MTHSITKEELLSKTDMFTEDEFTCLRNILGSIVLSWAQMEGGMTVLCQIVFSLVGSTKEFKTIPFPCERKITFLTDAFIQGGRFSTHADEASALLNRITELKKKRDALTHGWVCAYDRAGRTITFTRHQTKQEVINRYGIDSLIAAANESRSLAKEVAEFVLRFSEVLPP